MNPTPQELLKKIESANSLLLISHARPDGDTLGATLAFSHYLDLKDKKHDLFCADEPAQYFSYLPKINQYITDIHSLDVNHYDMIICLDHGSLKQSGVHEHIQNFTNSTHPTVCVNIDHHISNDRFADINYIHPDSSSTCEVLYELFTECDIPINQNMATCLMTGLITDTGNFTNSATNQKSLDAASRLVELGAKIPEINKNVIQNKNIPSLNLWGEIFSRLTINTKYKIAYTVVLPEDFEEKRVEKEALDGLINFLNSLENVRLVLLLVQEKPGLIKGSFRTTLDDVDVSRLAQVWGGGGHKKAAGFKIDGNLKKIDDKWAVV